MKTRSSVAEYQKAWFAALHERPAGAPLVLANADTPHEIFRAMDVPYVVNQWWASIIAAKRQATPALRKLAELGYPDYIRQYDVLSLGEMFLETADRPWGGLPTPSMFVADLSDDAVGKICDAWHEQFGTEVFPFERTALDPAPPGWWDLLPHDWERAYGSERLDLMEAEIRLLIAATERLTDRAFDVEKLQLILDLGNRQAEINRSTRDLIAGAERLPVNLGDVIPGVMIPQWHRGSEWAVEAATRLNDEVREAVTRGDAVCPGEKIRLMWIGRGLWGDMSLFTSFEESHHAVFVWSMYLAIAADGYARYGDDPIRTLAARFVGLTDGLYTPPWAGEWYVKEAKSHRVDGVVHLVADDVPGSSFTTRALEDHGIPVLELRASNADARTADPDEIRRRIAEFLDTRL
ncbi:2-hydroxyacyl-CoA dehydratase [Cryptosporangium sp. NPDC048952]|uniref:2-hydroxyacyl-CoA dehydratase n=1 Tax=Cryptosporangium sp. NPDC048952 TaxID=3363961 RepID=UPI003717BD9F